MSLYKDFLAFGYSDSEALELAHLAEDFENNLVADVELDEATKIIIDKFNELGCTSFRMSAEELAKIMKGQCYVEIDCTKRNSASTRV